MQQLADLWEVGGVRQTPGRERWRPCLDAQLQHQPCPVRLQTTNLLTHLFSLLSPRREQPRQQRQDFFTTTAFNQGELQEAVMELTVILALRPDQEHGCTEQQHPPQIHKAEHV